MTLTRLLNQKNLLAYTSLLFVMLASASQMASAAKPKYGYPVCMYFYENAGKQKLKSERSCFTVGGHGYKAMGGGDTNFKKITKIARAYAKPVQYISVKKGYTAEIHHKNAKGSMTKTKVTKSGPVDIRRNAMKGVRIWKTSDGKGKFPVCLYESKASLKKKKTKHALCLPFGEYRILEAYGWDDKAKYIDLNSKYKVYLYKDNNFDGNSTIMEKDGRIKMEGKNKSVSSIRIQKK